VRGAIVWPLTRQQDPSGLVVNKMRIFPVDVPAELPVHPGRDWFYVLEGTARLILGEREQLVETGSAAEFSTMTPHYIGPVGEFVDVLTIFDRHGERAHLQPVAGEA